MPDATAPLRDARIMLVDDEPSTLEMLQLMLEEQGYSRFLPVAESGEAVETAARARPDLILLDMLMPGVDGLEVLAGLRAHADLRHTPVLMFTASSDPAGKLEALELGATDFLTKPLDPSELALRLRNTLAAKRYRDYLAYSDTLTGLPNRRAFLDHVAKTLAQRREGSGPGALLQVDLGRFKQVNEVLGHRAGDGLLRAVAERLQAAVSAHDAALGRRLGSRLRASVLARLSGDEFVLLLPEVDDLENASGCARRLLDALQEPFRLAGQELRVTVGVGIACIPGDGDDVETLMRHAAVAASHVKRRSRHGYQYYREELNAEGCERMLLEQELRHALRHGELVLHYQPQVDLVTGDVCGLEALARWNHPRLGLLPPRRFIGIAEQGGLIVPLGEWALREACGQTRAWLDAGRRPPRVSVNVSSQQFRDGYLLGTIRDALRDAALDDASLLTVELTESLLMEAPEQAKTTLERIKAMGATVALDDFGTGYSSLSYLRRLAVDELKLDCCFVAGVPDSHEDRAITSATIDLAHGLGMQVVAEGVEHEPQREFLARRGCDRFQGFLYSKPVAAAAAARLFDTDGPGCRFTG